MNGSPDKHDMIKLISIYFSYLVLTGSRTTFDNISFLLAFPLRKKLMYYSLTRSSCHFGNQPSSSLFRAMAVISPISATFGTENWSVLEIQEYGSNKYSVT